MPAKRPCLDCQTPTHRRRCPACERRRDQARGSRQARGYDAAHDRLRKQWQRRIDAGEPVTCATCDAPLTGRAWDLGHDTDRTRYLGPQCITCNRATNSLPRPVNYLPTLY